MKKSLFICFFSLIALSLNAGYEIKVCLIPLSEIVQPEAKMWVGSLQHVFIRGADGTGLNFEPQDPMGFMGSQAKIGKQDYFMADCETILNFDSASEYNTAWNKIVAAFEDAAIKYQYSISEYNCQRVTKTVLSGLSYNFPVRFDEKLGQQKACSIQ
jgi:hypothetical protein